MDNEPKLTSGRAQEIGRLGGRKTLEKYGRDHYAQVGEYGGNLLFKQRGREYFVNLGRKSAEKRRKIQP